MIPASRLSRLLLPASIILAVALLNASCTPAPAVRPTPTFILDGLVFPGNPTQIAPQTSNNDSTFLPVVTGSEELPVAEAQATPAPPGTEVAVTATRQPTTRPTGQSSTPTPTQSQTATVTGQTATPTLLVIEPTAVQMRFAVIGDYGTGGASADRVAEMVRSWEPDIIITTGDNNLPSGSADTIDTNVGRLFHTYIFPYEGAFGDPADFNRFFPVLGAHDWISNNAAPYLDFFTLPGNERYYEFVYGPVQFYALDSDVHEPDGVTSDSNQASWLEDAVADSTACWNFAYFFHPPYSSGQDGNSIWMQWPFASMGIDAVFSGRDRHYERLEVDGIPFFVNGLGGNTITPFSAIQPGSQIHYNDDFGAMLVTADQDTAIFEFYNTNEDLVDYHLEQGGCQ